MTPRETIEMIEVLTNLLCVLKNSNEEDLRQIVLKKIEGLVQGF